METVEHLISCPMYTQPRNEVFGHDNVIKDLNRGGGQWRKMANNGEKWRKMAMANSAFSFVKFAIFRQFLILEFQI